MNSTLSALTRRQHGVFTPGQAVAAGYTEAEVRARIRSGDWVRVRRGVLAPAVTGDPLDQRAGHLRAAAAAVLVMNNPCTLSHRSAAIAHELPLIGRAPTDVALTLERQHRRRAPGLELHTAVTPPHHRTVVDGLPVTTVARTVSDLARSRPFAHAVVAADAALSTGACTSSDLEAVIRDCPVWPGIARTKRMLAFADRRSESPGESLSRVAITAAGLPAPEPQVELLLGGQHVRVDFMWVAERLVGEFDGRVKYGDAADLWHEKQREDLIRRHGYRVVRWTWADVYPRPESMVRLIRAALRG